MTDGWWCSSDVLTVSSGFWWCHCRTLSSQERLCVCSVGPTPINQFLLFIKSVWPSLPLCCFVLWFRLFFYFSFLFFSTSHDTRHTYIQPHRPALLHYSTSHASRVLLTMDYHQNVMNTDSGFKSSRWESFGPPLHAVTLLVCFEQCKCAGISESGPNNCCQMLVGFFLFFVSQTVSPRL